MLIDIDSEKEKEKQVEAAEEQKEAPAQIQLKASSSGEDKTLSQEMLLKLVRLQDNQVAWEQERTSWAEERRKWEQERAAWEKDRAVWEKEQEKNRAVWEKEQEKNRSELVIFFGEISLLFFFFKAKGKKALFYAYYNYGTLSTRRVCDLLANIVYEYHSKKINDCGINIQELESFGEINNWKCLKHYQSCSKKPNILDMAPALNLNKTRNVLIHDFMMVFY